jgi:hypothetical protein
MFKKLLLVPVLFVQVYPQAHDFWVPNHSFEGVEVVFERHSAEKTLDSSKEKVDCAFNKNTFVSFCTTLASSRLASLTLLGRVGIALSPLLRKPHKYSPIK